MAPNLCSSSNKVLLTVIFVLSMCTLVSASCSSFNEKNGLLNNTCECKECFWDGNQGYSISCTINDTKSFKFTDNVLILKLSHSPLKILRKGAFQQFPHLKKLILDHNEMEKIEDRAFEKLTSLQYLDLSYNKLQSWSSAILQDLPSLQHLNLQGNYDFTILNHQLNTNCTKIFGIKTSPTMKYCNLTRRTNINREELEDKLTGKFKRQCIYFPDHHLDKLEAVRKTFVSYEARCEGNKRFNLDVTNIASLEELLSDRCFKSVRKLRYIVFMLGSFAVILNIIVYSAILLIQRLRQNVPFMLIAHLSFCDFLIGVYALGTASGHETSRDYHGLRLFREASLKCGVFGVIFLLGQSLSVLTCLLVTIERYLATVHCMKPALKLQRRTALAIIPAFWVTAFVIAVPLQKIDHQKITPNFMCILIRDYNPNKGFLVGQGLMIAFIALYVVQVILYVRIYVYGKKSSRRVNVNRERKLAKRIGIIIMTNFVCFALPNLSMLTFTLLGIYVPLGDVANTILRRWLPPMCLVLNSCTNPCFFAYGNLRFSSTLRKSIRELSNKYLNFENLKVKNPKIIPITQMK